MIKGLREKITDEVDNYYKEHDGIIDAYDLTYQVISKLLSQFDTPEKLGEEIAVQLALNDDIEWSKLTKIVTDKDVLDPNHINHMHFWLVAEYLGKARQLLALFQPHALQAVDKVKQDCELEKQMLQEHIKETIDEAVKKARKEVINTFSEGGGEDIYGDAGKGDFVIFSIPLNIWQALKESDAK